VADNLYDNLKRRWYPGDEDSGTCDVEERVAGDGLEILRQLVQVHFDVRARDEVRRESVTGSDGVCEPSQGRCERSLETLFGDITVSRVGYSQRDTTSLFPLDAELICQRISTVMV